MAIKRPGAAFVNFCLFAVGYECTGSALSGSNGAERDSERSLEFCVGLRSRSPLSLDRPCRQYLQPPAARHLMSSCKILSAVRSDNAAMVSVGLAVAPVGNVLLPTRYKLS